MKDVIIYDLDGTLSNGVHRLHLVPPVEERRKDAPWLAFNMAAIDDLPIEDNIELLYWHNFSHRVIIVTARTEAVRGITEHWLKDNGVKYDELIMRPVGDCSLDVDFKDRVFKNIGLHNILCAYDDKLEICNHFRSLGVTCHHVCDSSHPFAQGTKG